MQCNPLDCGLWMCGVCSSVCVCVFCILYPIDGCVLSPSHSLVTMTCSQRWRFTSVWFCISKEVLDWMVILRKLGDISAPFLFGMADTRTDCRNEHFDVRSINQTINIYYKNQLCVRGNTKPSIVTTNSIDTLPLCLSQFEQWLIRLAFGLGILCCNDWTLMWPNCG